MKITNAVILFEKETGNECFKLEKMNWDSNCFIMSGLDKKDYFVNLSTNEVTRSYSDDPFENYWNDKK
jgi:hypothetical protein